jgi:hypothetical protein
MADVQESSTGVHIKAEEGRGVGGSKQLVVTNKKIFYKLLQLVLVLVHSNTF